MSDIQKTARLEQKPELLTNQFLLQCNTILQMDCQELQDYLLDFSESNPFAELVFPAAEPSPVSVSSVMREQDYKMADGDFTELVPDVRDANTLYRSVVSQIRISFREEELPPILYLAGFLDENGYLRPAFPVICREAPWSPGILAEALKKLQSLAPAGIGASDLTECLLLQLEETQELERTLVEDHLYDIANHNISGLAKELKVSPARLERAVRTIRRLSPKPGQEYPTGEAPVYIVPDIIAELSPAGELELRVFENDITLRPGADYLNLLRHCNDPETADYLAEKYRRFVYVQKAVENRRDFVRRLTELVLLHQKDFFKYGPGALQCLSMREAAGLLGVHESTVSRAVRGKYLTCSYGTFPLKRFFARSSSKQGRSVSKEEAKSAVASLIRNEAAGTPSSDREICEALALRGIPISRRTVAKYRLELGIPNSSSRTYIKRKGAVKHV